MREGLDPFQRSFPRPAERSAKSITLLTVARELTEAGVQESFRAIKPQDASLEQFAIYADPEG